MKNLLLPTMILAAALASCSQDEPASGVQGSASSLSDLLGINVYATTSRASDTTTESLEFKGEIILHIDDYVGDTQTCEFEYSQDLGEWSQVSGSSLTWSNVDFPANFYSLHDGEAFEELTFTDVAAVYNDYTVTGASTEHKDLVYHASKLSAIPTGGTINAYHKHALSKIHLYAATGTNNVYIARVQLVNFDGKGNVTITPLDADQISTSNGVSWENSGTSDQTYQYFFLDGEDPSAINTADQTDGSDPIINDSGDAPLMIIPQSTTAATIKSTSNSVITFEGTYVEVIYYMTDADDMPLVGYSAVKARSDASKYITENQEITLYVMGAFPLKHTFVANNEYDITLGLGADGSSGGILVADYYVDESGGEIKLTKVGESTSSAEEIPEIDEGDDILAGSDDYICIVVTAHEWVDGGTKEVEYTSAAE